MDGQKSEETPTQFAPGDTIRPAQQTVASEPPVEQLPPQQAPEQVQTFQQANITEPATTYTTSPVEDDVFSWTASEFIAHHKTAGWYGVLLVASCVAAALIWLITKDIVSSLVVVFAAVMFAAYAGRQPRQLTYQLDPSGLTVAQRHYAYNEFRSFSVVPEGAFSSIIFSPLKRFGTLMTIYYDPKDEDKIIEIISQRLPHEQRRPDLVDSIMSRIRF